METVDPLGVNASMQHEGDISAVNLSNPLVWSDALIVGVGNIQSFCPFFLAAQTAMAGWRPVRLLPPQTRRRILPHPNRRRKRPVASSAASQKRSPMAP